MVIPTEPIGSIPRPPELLAALASTDGADPALDPLYEAAIRDTVARFEATGSPVVTDGEQRWAAAQQVVVPPGAGQVVGRQTGFLRGPRP